LGFSVRDQTALLVLTVLAVEVVLAEQRVLIMVAPAVERLEVITVAGLVQQMEPLILAAMVGLVRSESSIPATRVASHQQTQETCNGIIYSHSKRPAF
jgi:hypothetical protein